MIPTSKDDIEEFTPDSLTNVVPKPVFRLRPATDRDQREFFRRLKRACLSYVSEQDLRDIMLEELKRFSSEAEYEEGATWLRTFWASLDQAIAVASDDVVKYGQIFQQLRKASDIFNDAVVAKAEFDEDYPKIVVGLYLAGYSGLETPFRMISGVVPIETIDALERELRGIEAKAIADKVEGVEESLSFMQLALKGLSLLGLTKDEEKNSERPAGSDSTPSSSETDGQASPEDGSSAPKPGRKTPEKASAKTT